MMRISIHAAVTAGVLSLLLHILGLEFAAREDQSPPTEDGASAPADVGRAFDDFAEITPEIEAPEPAPVPEPPNVTPPEQVIEETPTTRALVASDNPQDVRVPDTGTGDVVKPDAAEPSAIEAVTPETAGQSEGEDDRFEDMAALTPLEPDRAAEVPQGTPEANPGPVAPQISYTAPLPAIETVSPDARAASPGAALGPEPEEQQPVRPENTVAPQSDDPDTLTALDSEAAPGPAVTTSLRPPKTRPSVPASSLREGARTGRASGTIESPLTAYKRTGIDPFASGSGGAARSGTSGFSGARNPGNASTTNYVGRVLVQLNRSPVVHPYVRGTAQVSFAINPDGTVAWVSILGTSGSGGIGQAATAQVRRAGPFPPPPQGTSQRLVFVYRNG